MAELVSNLMPNPFDDEIPVIDASGKRLILKGAVFSEPAPAPVARPAAPKPPVEPPHNLPVAPLPTAAAAPAPAAIQSTPPSATPAPKPPAPAPRPAPLKITEAVAPAVQPSAPLSRVTTDDFNLAGSADQADLKKVQATAAMKTVENATPKAEVTQLDASVDEAVTASGVPLNNEDVRNRYRMLVSLYFRGLRDALETKSKFTMPVQSGGMGFADPEAERVIALLRARNDAYQAALQGKAAGDKAQYVSGRMDKVLGAQDETDRKEEQKMEQAFSGLVERTGVKLPATAAAPMPSAAAPARPVEMPKPPRMVPVIGLDEKKPEITPVMATAAPVRTAGGTALGDPDSAQPVSQDGRALTGKNAVTGPAALPERMEPASTPPRTVTDIAYAPRLTGPVDEIRSMTLKDFRRLSRDPREATLKIKDKIDLLEEQSFDMKTQGVRAWQESGVNKTYLDLLRASLEGTPVTDLIAEKEKDGAEVLTKPEFDAIMDLNRTLRFG